MKTYDVIVLGTGGVGSAAAMHLAARGAKVLGLEQFDHGHNRGSSHGQTRAIRMAYFEHPDYVPLLRRAYSLWDELESSSGQKLFHQNGLLEVGPADGIVVPGVLRSATEHSLPVDELSRKEVEERFPGFIMPDDALAVFEQNAGFLFVEDSVLAHVSQATKFGAEMRANERVVEWNAKSDSVSVRTEFDEYQAGRLVITAGAWAGELLRKLNVPLTVRRMHLHWYAAANDRYRLENGVPTFFFELPDRSFFYGFPQLDERGVKVAEHGSGGEIVENATQLSRDVDATDRARVEAFVTKHLAEVTMQPTRHCVCLYTMTADENFIVDTHPEHPHVCFAAGLSGHGFKFTTVLGEALADLALNASTALPIDFLSVSRFQD